MQNRCKYIEKYNELDTKEEQTFTCPEPLHSQEFCIFHDPDYWMTKPTEIVKQIHNKISNNCNNENSKLYFIGYNLPSITITENENYLGTLYFDNASFHGTIYFKSICFKKISFSKSTFKNKVFFENIKFLEGSSFKQINILPSSEIKFEKCFFFEPVDFSKSIFSGPIKFENVQFAEVNFNFSEFKDNGTIYLRNIICSKKAEFRYIKFNGNDRIYILNSHFHCSSFHNCIFSKGIAIRTEPSNETNVKQKVMDFFIGYTDFSYCNFGGDVFFHNIIFKEKDKDKDKANFQKAHFANTSIATFENIDFNIETDFSYVTFDSHIFFLNSKFHQSADFSNIKTSDNSICTFLNLEFHNQTDFSECIFNEKMFLTGIQFKGYVNFDNTIFNKATFNSIFESYVSFINTTFNKTIKFGEKCCFKDISDKTEQISFKYAHFIGKIEFEKIVFNRIVNFRNVCFGHDSQTTFNKVTFEKEIDFSDAHSVNTSIISFYACFNDIAKFKHAVFEGKINFVRYENGNNIKENDFRIFAKKTYFDYTKFYDVVFKEIEFYDIVSFQNTYLKNAVFSDVNFKENVNFTYSIFKSVKFTDTIKGICNQMDFKFLTLEEGNEILFDTDLSKASFANTDITRVHFNEHIKWGDQQFVIFDEKFLKDSLECIDSLDYLFNQIKLDTGITRCIKFSFNGTIHFITIYKDKKQARVKFNNENKEYLFNIDDSSNKIKFESQPSISVDGVKSIYRKLRENHEYWFRNEEADEFYKREMEIERQYREIHSNSKIYNKKNNLFRRNLSLTGLYRIFCSYGLNYTKPTILAGIVIAIPIVYFLIEALSNPTPTNSTISIYEQLYNKTASTIGVKPEEFQGYLVKGISFSFLGILIVSALKRKFERKIRK